MILQFRTSYFFVFSGLDIAPTGLTRFLLVRRKEEQNIDDFFYPSETNNTIDRLKKEIPEWNDRLMIAKRIQFHGVTILALLGLNGIRLAVLTGQQPNIGDDSRDDG